MNTSTPLPVGWTEHRGPEDRPYWYNAFTGQSQWFPPLVNPTIPPPLPSQPPPATALEPPKEQKAKIKKKRKLIPGTQWYLVQTDDGLEFYYDKENKKSLWDMPPELEIPMQQMKQAEQDEADRKRSLRDQDIEVHGRLLSKRVKHRAEPAEPAETTEMTEEDIMWQLQNMEPEQEQEQEQEQGQGQQEEAVIGNAAADHDNHGNYVQNEVVESHAKPEPREQQKPRQALSQTPSSPQRQPEQETIPGGSEEEHIEQFTIMLSEKDISPYSTWERELPKIINDPRYSLVQPLGKRKQLFNNFCRVLVERQKEARKHEKQKSPEEEYLSLLQEMVTGNKKMYWEDFRRKAKNDSRFKAIKESRTREALFKDYVRSKRTRSKEDAYRELLRESKDIVPGMRWRDAKLILEKDDRYHAIDSRTEREDMFRDYLDELAKKGRSSTH